MFSSHIAHIADAQDAGEKGEGDKTAFVIYAFRRRFSRITCHSSNFYFPIFCPRKLDMTHLILVLLG